ncbi:hypothetical protein NC651_037417 [Populus alba x Populus x berolinensis]|nr:hypothetical protein NC651_037417 [Populus alba x Populus x berolinensis]
MMVQVGAKLTAKQMQDPITFCFKQCCSVNDLGKHSLHCNHLHHFSVLPVLMQTFHNTLKDPTPP